VSAATKQKWLKSKPSRAKSNNNNLPTATCHYFMPLQRNSIAFFAFMKLYACVPHPLTPHFSLCTVLLKYSSNSSPLPSLV